MADAVRLMSLRLGAIEAISSFFESEPIGPADRPFLNAALQISSDLAPLRLLKGLQEIEAELGRVRKVRWGNRTIDLDIIFWFFRESPCFLSCETLCIPHPEWRRRRFVVEPLAEIFPKESYGGESLIGLLEE